MWGMRTETVPVIIGALGLIREGMDQNLVKIPGARNINELQKIILLGNGTHTEKVSVDQIKKLLWYLRTIIGPGSRGVLEAINSI